MMENTTLLCKKKRRALDGGDIVRFVYRIIEMLGPGQSIDGVV
jgi:hypothetical protein